MVEILSIEFDLIDLMSMFYPNYFIIKKFKVNLLVSPKIERLAKIRRQIRSFHKILP